MQGLVHVSLGRTCIPPFKEANLYVPEYYTRELADHRNVRVKLNTVATVDVVLGQKPTP